MNATIRVHGVTLEVPTTPHHVIEIHCDDIYSLWIAGHGHFVMVDHTHDSVIYAARCIVVDVGDLEAFQAGGEIFDERVRGYAIAGPCGEFAYVLVDEKDDLDWLAETDSVVVWDSVKGE